MCKFFSTNRSFYKEFTFVHGVLRRFALVDYASHFRCTHGLVLKGNLPLYTIIKVYSRVRLRALIGPALRGKIRFGGSFFVQGY